MLFHLGQPQQLVDGLGQAPLLLRDVGGETLAVGLGQRFLQQLGGTADRRQRALHLVRERLHVLLDIGLALELAAHGLQRLAEVADLVAARPRRRHRFAGADRLRIAAQAADAARQPPGHQQPDQRRRADQPRAARDDGALAGGDERIDAVVGLGQGQHPDQGAAIVRIVDRRGHVHDRAVGIARGPRARARTVLAAQGAVDVVPARVVAAHVLPARVVDDDAAGIGHGDPVVDAALGEPPHHRPRVAPLRGRHVRGEAAVGDVPGLQIRRGHHRQHVGRVDQGGLHRLAHARLDLVDEHPHHEERGDADDQEEAEEEFQAQAHLSPPSFLEQTLSVPFGERVGSLCSCKEQ